MSTQRDYEFPPVSWMNWFVPAREWWQRWLWWLPMLQLQINLRTPQDLSGRVVPFWFPVLRAGLNNIPNYQRTHFIVNCGIAWLGISIDAGFCLPRRRSNS